MTINDVVDREPRTAAAARARRRQKAQRLCAELLDRAAELPLTELAAVTVALLAEAERRRLAGETVNLVPVLLAEDVMFELEYMARAMGVPVPESVETLLRRVFWPPALAEVTS